MDDETLREEGERLAANARARFDRKSKTPYPIVGGPIPMPQSDPPDLDEVGRVVAAVTFWDRVAQAHRWIRPRRAR